MIKKILVPVDGSEQSYKATEFAANLAKLSDATIHLLHVYRLSVIPEGIGDYVIADRVELLALGNKIIALAEDEAKKKGVKHIETTVIEGDPSERIMIGSRGLGTFKGLLLGSVSNKVSHRADRTCVIVR